MKTLFQEVRAALFSTLFLLILCCGAYPVTVWGLSYFVSPAKALGGLIVDKEGAVIGARLIGQGFSSSRYFHPRPSAAGNGYDALSSGGSNLGPTSRKLAEAIRERVAAYREENKLPASEPVPADAVTASASGLDPHITPRNAWLQAERVAFARSMDVQQLRSLILRHTEGPDFGFLGEARVNVLELNLDLDGRLH